MFCRPLTADVSIDLALGKIGSLSRGITRKIIGRVFIHVYIYMNKNLIGIFNRNYTYSSGDSCV